MNVVVYPDNRIGGVIQHQDMIPKFIELADIESISVISGNSDCIIAIRKFSKEVIYTPFKDCVWLGLGGSLSDKTLAPTWLELMKSKLAVIKRPEILPTGHQIVKFRPSLVVKPKYRIVSFCKLKKVS